MQYPPKQHEDADSGLKKKITTLKCFMRNLFALTKNGISNQFICDCGKWSAIRFTLTEFSGRAKVRKLHFPKHAIVFCVDARECSAALLIHYFLNIIIGYTIVHGNRNICKFHFTRIVMRFMCLHKRVFCIPSIQ